MGNYSVLICDDEPDIVNALKIYLKNEGYDFFTAYNGRDALRILHDEKIDVCVMDIMMPEMDGIATLSELRSFSNVPVIFLTAKSEDTDKVLGLNLGADDYVTKPFNAVELTARIRSQIRRYTMLGSAPASPDTLKIGGIQIRYEDKQVTVDGEIVSLTPKEYSILRFLMEHPGECFSPPEIYRAVWGDVPIGVNNAVAVHMRHLREKIEIDSAAPRYLKVVWGKGYKFERPKN
ncbi:MAG: response regulator transcription factor [Oscillospiraceae bacterium]|nr:response regulator transcription factor [Oscillospiraceae bacterium]